MSEAALLEVNAIDAHYGMVQALFGVSLRVNSGETIAIIGANGAGKTTLMKAIMGLVPIRAGEIRLRGLAIDQTPTQKIVALGLTLVPEGRRLFSSLSVEENLRVGGQLRRPGPWTLDKVYAVFPILKERRRQPATSLSGGQQQMVAIGRALMANPDLLLIDELSLGLAPIVIRDIYRALSMITADATTAVIVEQDTGQALAVADRVYCLRGGRICLEGKSAELDRDTVSKAYFGV